MRRYRERVELNIDALEFINGELLGDGHLTYHSNRAGSQYMCSSKYREYLEWLSDKFNSFGIEQSGKIRFIQNKFGTAWNYSSKSYVDLKDIRLKWYPNGKKRIPKDLELTPTTMRQWFIGDGNLYYIAGKYPITRFATYGYPQEDVELLVRKINDLGIKCSRYPSDNCIGISRGYIGQFYNYMAKCPDEIKEVYHYKWRC